MCPSQKRRRRRGVLLTLTMTTGRLFRTIKQTQTAAETDYLFSGGPGTVEQGKPYWVEYQNGHIRDHGIFYGGEPETLAGGNRKMRMGRGKISPQVIRGFMKNTDMNFSKRKRMSRVRTPGYTAKKAFTKMAAEAGLQRRRLCLSENTAGIRFCTHTIS